jgi:uncharacterized protein YggE
MKRMIPACLLTLTLVSAAISLKAQTAVSNPYPKTITVNGSAEMEVVPDEIYVIVDLKEYEKKSNKTNIDKIKSDFLSSCRSIGLPDSAITIASYEGYNGNPWYRKRNKRDDLLASISYQIKFTDSKKMDELVDKLDDDATQNFRIVRTSHSKIQEYRKQLKIQAVKAAKDKAGYLAEAIDEKVGTAVTITEPGDVTMEPYALQENVAISQYKMAETKGSGGGIGLDFRKIKLRFEVNVVFALR